MGHDDFDRSIPPRPEHAFCNRRVVSHLKEQLAAATGSAAGSNTDPYPPGNRVTHWSRHWDPPGSGYNSRCPHCRVLGAACGVGLGKA
jgi:hypothetical protein